MPWNYEIRHPQQNINHGELMTLLKEMQKRIENLEYTVILLLQPSAIETINNSVIEKIRRSLKDIPFLDEKEIFKED
jgi:hypothetical protein